MSAIIMVQTYQDGMYISHAAATAAQLVLSATNKSIFHSQLSSPVPSGPPLNLVAVAIHQLSLWCNRSGVPQSHIHSVTQ